MNATFFPHPTITTSHIATTDQIASDLGKTAVGVIAGTVAGFALNLFPLVGGALFCAASSFSFPCIEQVLLKMIPDSHRTNVKTAIKAAAIFSSICLGSLAISFVGFPATALTMIAMTAAVHITAYALQNQSMGYSNHRTFG